MGELHALGARCGPRGVVDRCSGVFVGFPRFGRDAELHEDRVALGADDHLVFAFDASQGVLELWIDQEYTCTGVLHDVTDLSSDEPEVHRDEHTARTGHAEQRGQQARRVVADHRNAFALLNAEGIQTGSHRTGALGHVAIGDRTP